MTITHTQNRPYTPEKVMVKATFKYPNDHGGLNTETFTFNWNARDEVRNFASQSDRIIRMGGSTLLERALS